MAGIGLHAQDAAPLCIRKARAASRESVGGALTKRHEEEPSNQAGGIALTLPLPLRMLVPGFQIRCRSPPPGSVAGH